MIATRLSVLFAAGLLAVNAWSAPLFRKALPIDLNWVWATGDPGPLATSDFNGDGFPDIAYAHSDGRLVIAMSAAGGPFAPSKISPLPSGVGAMAAGDVDGDSHNDLVYRRGSDSGVLLGNGDGTFTAGPAGPSTVIGPIAVGDVNGDGKPDLVAAAETSNFQTVEILVHLGDGAGGFAAGVSFPTPFNYARQIALVDLNGDGRADVITGGTQTSVYLSGTGGTLQFGWQHGGGSFALGHMNADAVLDLAVRVANLDTPRLRIFFGAGDGTFAMASEQPTVLGTEIDLADFDGDSVDDIVSMGGAGIAIARGLGNGSFAEPLMTTAGGAGQFVTGDFDRDGNRDVVYVYGQVASLHLSRGNGDGTFREDRAYLAGSVGQGAEGLSALDMNGDGHPDATTLVGTSQGTWSISVLKNDGTGGLLAPTSTPTALDDPVSAFLVGSLDGNDRPDVVVVTTGDGIVTATSFLGAGDATFTQSSSIVLTTPDIWSPKLADLTGDGSADLLVNGDLYEGNGDGSFDAARATGASFDVVGDVDGNGTIDAIWRASQLAVALNDGSGNFSAPAYFGTGSDFPNVLGDFDGDHILDLFCTRTEGTRVFLGHGDGTFHAPVDVAVSDRPGSASTADFDLDGDLDLVAGSDVLLGNGDGRFRSLEFIGGTTWAPAVADFDGNGRPDILRLSGSVVVVHRAGLVAEPTRNSNTTVSAFTPPEHGSVTSYPAHVTGHATPVLGGAVLYTIGGLPVGLSRLWLNMSVPPETAGTATSLLALPVGTHTITAAYLGSETYLPSSGTTTVTVDRGMTSLQKTGMSSVEYGSKLTIGWTLTASVAPGLPGPDTTSAFTLTEGGLPLSDVQWLSGSAVVLGLEIGSHTLTLEFAGDANYKPSSTTFVINVSKRNPQITWSYAPLGSARVAGDVTIAVTFVEQDYGSTTGSVAFTLNQAEIGTFPISASRAEVTTTLAAGFYSVTMSYAGDSGNNAFAQTSTFHVYGPAGVPPAMLATSAGGIVQLSWVPATDAASYRLYYRGSYLDPWLFFGTSLGPNRSASLPAGKTRMYAVAVVDQNGATGAIGPPDIATNVAFSDVPVIPGTPMRAAHVTQLRTAVNAVRTFAGLAVFTFTDVTLPGTNVRALHLTELRDALSEARTAIAMPMAFSPQAPAAGATIRSTHIEELRAGVR